MTSAMLERIAAKPIRPSLYGTYLTERERDMLVLEIRLLKRQLERFAVCPDHRDKGDGACCIVCKFEESARRDERSER